VREREREHEMGLGFKLRHRQKEVQAVSVAVVFLLPDCLLGLSVFSRLSVVSNLFWNLQLAKTLHRGEEDKGSCESYRDNANTSSTMSISPDCHNCCDNNCITTGA
jgi:hypothetical protein